MAVDPNCLCGGCTRERTATTLANLRVQLAGAIKAIEVTADHGLVDYHELRAENARLRAKCRALGLRMAITWLELVAHVPVDDPDYAEEERNRQRLKRVLALKDSGGSGE